MRFPPPISPRLKNAGIRVKNILTATGNALTADVKLVNLNSKALQPLVEVPPKAPRTPRPSRDLSWIVTPIATLEALVFAGMMSLFVTKLPSKVTPALTDCVIPKVAHVAEEKAKPIIGWAHKLSNDACFAEMIPKLKPGKNPERVNFHPTLKETPTMNPLRTIVTSGNKKYEVVSMPNGELDGFLGIGAGQRQTKVYPLSPEDQIKHEITPFKTLLPDLSLKWTTRPPSTVHERPLYDTSIYNPDA
ncbi:MAG: hypothetical protein HEQ32_01340 [Vampirovibrio sp.]